MPSDTPLHASTAHAAHAAADTADSALVQTLLGQLQRAGAKLPQASQAAQLRGILAAHGLDLGFHRRHLPNEATWWALLQQVAAWSPEAACLLATAALSHEAGLPASCDEADLAGEFDGH